MEAALPLAAGRSLSHERWLRMAADLRAGFGSWRIWWLLGIGDIRQRYSRSRVGQFWITLSMAFFVFALGVVYSTILQQPIATYLPFLAANLVTWSLISGIVIDSTTTFTQAETILRQEPLPRTVFVLRLLVRNFVAFAHNLVIVPIVFAMFGQWPSWTWLMVPIGLVLVAMAGFLVALICGILCTRFRDLPQIVNNIVQIAFFVSPVTWPITALRDRADWVVGLNPFAAFLRIVSEPMRGEMPGFLTYLSTLVVLMLLLAVALPLFARFRSRIVYWL